MSHCLSLGEGPGMAKSRGPCVARACAPRVPPAEVSAESWGDLHAWRVPHRPGIAGLEAERGGILSNHYFLLLHKHRIVAAWALCARYLQDRVALEVRTLQSGNFLFLFLSCLPLAQDPIGGPLLPQGNLTKPWDFVRSASMFSMLRAEWA